MVSKIYTVKDKVADEFGPIFNAANDAVASRNFKQLLGSTPYPEDFELYEVGSFSNETGWIEADAGPTFVADYSSFKDPTVFEVPENG